MDRFQVIEEGEQHGTAGRRGDGPIDVPPDCTFGLENGERLAPLAARQAEGLAERPSGWQPRDFRQPVLGLMSLELGQRALSLVHFPPAALHLANILLGEVDPVKRYGDWTEDYCRRSG
jgi:hypothetical protein